MGTNIRICNRRHSPDSSQPRRLRGLSTRKHHARRQFYPLETACTHEEILSRWHHVPKGENHTGWQHTDTKKGLRHFSTVQSKQWRSRWKHTRIYVRKSLRSFAVTASFSDFFLNNDLWSDTVVSEHLCVTLISFQTPMLFDHIRYPTNLGKVRQIRVGLRICKVRSGWLKTERQNTETTNSCKVLYPSAFHACDAVLSLLNDGLGATSSPGVHKIGEYPYKGDEFCLTGHFAVESHFTMSLFI